MNREKITHCWESSPGQGATCLLPDGHEGPHEFTPDSEILLTFGGVAEEKERKEDGP